MELSLNDKHHLLALARFSIESGFHPSRKGYHTPENLPVLKSKSGAFVTITIEGKLRGCIGYILTDDELSKTIMDAAYQAAFNDPRFSPLTESEFPLIKLEISILSEPFTLESYDDIIIGQHGLILEEGGRKGLLLPQVPIEHKMNKEEYLSALCNKAGFFEDYWREKQLKLKAFTATVFSENEEDENHDS